MAIFLISTFLTTEDKPGKNNTFVSSSNRDRASFKHCRSYCASLKRASFLPVTWLVGEKQSEHDMGEDGEKPFAISHSGKSTELRFLSSESWVTNPSSLYIRHMVDRCRQAALAKYFWQTLGKHSLPRPSDEESRHPMNANAYGHVVWFAKVVRSQWKNVSVVAVEVFWDAIATSAYIAITILCLAVCPLAPVREVCTIFYLGCMHMQVVWEFPFEDTAIVTWHINRDKGLAIISVSMRQTWVWLLSSSLVKSESISSRRPIKSLEKYGPTTASMYSSALERRRWEKVKRKEKRIIQFPWQGWVDKAPYEYNRINVIQYPLDSTVSKLSLTLG